MGGSQQITRTRDLPLKLTALVPNPNLATCVPCASRRPGLTRNTMTAKMRALLLSAALLFGAPAAVAQEAGSGTLEQGSTVTDKEKIEFVSAAIEEMSATVKAVSKQLEDAEKEGDDLKIKCLSKKLAAIQALSDVSGNAQDAMEKAIEDGESAGAQHEFRKVAVALSKVRQFKAEADACVSDSSSTPGVTNVNVSVDGLTSGNDTELMGDSDFDVGSIPPNTSPFQ